MPCVSLARLFDELKALYAPPIRRPATWEKLRQVLTEFRALPGVRAVGDLRPTAIAAWVRAHPGRSPRTAHALLRSLRAACSYAAKSGYLKDDPFAWRGPAAWVDLDATPAREAFDRHKSAEEVSRVLYRADFEARLGGWREHRLRALVYLLAFTGMRAREALGSMVADFDLAAGFVWLKSNPRRPLKTRGSGAPLALAEPLKDVLSRWLPHTDGPWAVPGLARNGPWLWGGPGVRALDQVKALGERAGVSGLTLLSFRHTLATLSEGWGVGELELQRWLRHTRAATQKGYRRHADLDVVKATAGKIQFKLGPPPDRLIG